MSATFDDHFHRLQLFMCCIAENGYLLSKKLRISANCCCDIERLNILTMYWCTLECYNPDVDTNCLTQEQIDLIWEDISKKCGLCFAPYGSVYTTGHVGNRLVAGNGDIIVDENGNYLYL